MAGEAPISDVLCEAMEYLCKLGTNLRLRSEGLKEKRIRRDKLKNSHAVQKAADKVLLICELSKKSLENVESEVRKVLSIVNERYVETKTKASPSKSGDNVDKYQYFRHQSHKLKISKKVPVKHYLSVKVLARRMTKVMQDNYPVYFDCKLYRQRRKQEIACRSKDVSSDLNVLSDSKIDKATNDTKDKKCETLALVEKENEKEESLYKDAMSINSTSISNTLTKSNEDQMSTCSDNDSSRKNNPYQSDLEKSIQNTVHNRDLNKNANNVTKSKKRERTPKKLKRIRLIDDSSDSNEPIPDHKSKDTEINAVSEQNISDDAVETNLEQECGIKRRKLNASHASKEIRKISFNNEMKESLVSNETKKYDTTKNLDDTVQKCDTTENLEDMAQKYDTTENSEDTVQKHDATENSKDTVHKNDTEDVRPMIKCVNISKLLKTGVLEIPDNEHKSANENKNIPKINTKDLKRKNNLSKSGSSNSDDDYWLQKRKEVSAFKPKKCTIGISRLPKLSVKFLQIHSLRKITQENVIIIELKNSKETDDVCKSKSSKINTVKKALLRDSESEKSDEDNSSMAAADIVNKEALNPQREDEICNTKSNKLSTVKKALLRDSESEKSDDNSCVVPTDIVNDVIKETPTNTKKYDDNNRETEEQIVKNAEDIETNKTTQVVELENNTEKLKQSLLYESDSDGVEKCKESSGNEKSKCTDMDTTENVKNDLLNESDLDKIEDISKQSQNSIPKPESNDSTALNKENEESPDKESQCKNSEDVETKSPDDIPKTPPNERRKSKSVTPRSKRKNIMESMHAKKMLLTYSSSSDTEDEQLRNALKEIKDSLLKGISSDDDNVEKEVSKPHSSSESDEDILDKINKKKESLAETAESREDNESSQGSSKKIGRSRKQRRGSSQNTDSQASSDKNIYGLTNLKTLMKNRRRVDSTSTDDKTDSNSIRKTRKMPKAPLISEENMLNAECSSDAPSGAESDGSEEDLPPVELSGLNGSGGDHLAKDDLLGESDTSTSHNEKEEGDKNDSEDENNLKAKRRKANAISSDSEVGSSRKKEQDVRLSDFEDSEDESSDAVKKSKRKKKEIDSDASVGSSSNDGSQRKRRRIKQLNDSDASGSDTENEGRNKHGRKNIRKVMGKNQLEEATKKAAREEKERIARIAERQKVYNNLEFDESGKPDEVVLEKVILDFDPETKEPLIEVDRGLVKKLKPHQANGIKFMWDACFESVKRIKKDKGSGCILAHCMGLGKTLQVVSLTHTLLIHGDLTTVNRVLVVCPLSTVLNWVNEFKMWLKYSVTEYDVDVYELSRYKQNSERAFQLQQWFEGGGVCVLGYEMFRNLSADNPKKFKKKMLRHFQEALVDPGPDLVVCDEGHLLKNEKTSLSQSMNRVKTRRRIVLTGTPLQNNLKEYYCMVQFVKPNLLGKYNEYLNRFVNPITNGQYTDSTEHDIRIMKRRSHVLHKMLDGAVQRRDYGVLAPFLPPKHEYVLFITLAEVQTKLYQYYLDNYSRRPLAGKSSGFLFPDFQSLQRIWTHPLVLKYNSERYEIMQQKKREREEEEDSEGSLVDFIDDDSTPDESSTEESSDDLSDVSDDSRKKNKKKKSQKKGKGKDAKMSTRRATRANPIELEDDEPNEVVEMKAENPTEWWIKLVTEDELEDMRFSHKLILLFDILRQCEAIGDKLLVFSQSLYSLDLIEHFLGKVDEATQEGRIDEKLGGHVGSWSPGVDYFRLDGSTSCENRSIWCKNFNREDNPRARLFLISTRAGGLGINLVAANRVVIFDVSWNPSHDVQSIFRVYRFGQKKPCYIYRFLAMGTMEEKIYERQVTKQAISKRVIDEQQIDRHYAENDLAELYKFEPTPPTPRPLPPLPKDRLFAEMLREHEAQIYKYHEHDSLLENKEEETLSEEERKAAWEDFENEKNRPPPAPFPSVWPMHNGMVPGLLAQQQQQLAYAALAAMLRKDMPNINDNQIRDMLPLIYNANPALMQKMTEIYKYAPGAMNAMMNPAMMNQVMNTGMNTAASVGGAVGGSSGLQYSPPWQRQHQQQQQMRLQQLMQHQNLGAKYYAGGLGSRDPVAMALQQQRAREIMAGEQARARPRGRPPSAPARPAPPADVVNLDSD